MKDSSAFSLPPKNRVLNGSILVWTMARKRLFTYYRSIGSSWQGHLQDRAIYDAVNESERQDVAAQGPAEVRDTPT